MTEGTAGQVEETVQQMAELHGQHARQAGALQKSADALTAVIGRPGAATALLVLVSMWVLYNVAAPRLGALQPDPPPFGYLDIFVSVLALAVTILILTSQRRADVAATQRSQLTLQLAALSEQKIAKVIALIEEQRKENPALPNRPDPQADEMAVAVDPKTVLARIIDTHEEAERGEG